MAECILAYDVGTTGAKAVLLQSSGRLIAAASRSYQTLYPRSGWAEQNPEGWWRAVVESTREIVERVPSSKRRVACIGVSGHMLGCLPVDGSGARLRNAMIHSDTRAIAQWKRLSGELDQERIYAISGNRIAPQSTICKIMWLKENEHKTYKRTARFLQSKDYLTSRLTGGEPRTDYSDASHSVLLDVARRKWSSELLDAAGLDGSKLPDVYPSAAIAGSLNKTSASALGLPSGIPVVVGGGDGACASVGAGAVRPGQAYTYLGGTAWIALTLAKPFIDKKMRVFNIIGLDPRTCGVYGTIQCAGSAHQWLARILGVRSYQRLDRLVSASPPGSKGLFFLPYLMGERSPVWDPYARGVYFGLSLSHGRSELARATLEGICYALKSVLEVLEGAATVGEMRLIGGGARSKAWNSILASMFGRKLVGLTLAGEATCCGAAVAAGVGVGLFPDYESGAERMGRTARPCLPDNEAQKRYEQFFRFYRSLYPRMKVSYQALHDLAQEG